MPATSNVFQAATTTQVQQPKQQYTQHGFFDSSSDDDEIDEDTLNKIISSGEYSGEQKPVVSIPDVVEIKPEPYTHNTTFVNEPHVAAKQEIKPKVEFNVTQKKQSSETSQNTQKPTKRLIAKVEDQLPAIQPNFAEKVLRKMKKFSEKRKNQVQRSSSSLTEEDITMFTQMPRNDEDENSDEVVYDSHRGTQINRTQGNEDALLDALMN